MIGRDDEALEHSFQSPGAFDLAPGLWRLERSDGRRIPLLLLPDESLALSLSPSPEGFARVPAGHYLAELTLRVRHSAAPFTIALREVSVADYREFLVALGRMRGRVDGAVVAPRSEALPFLPVAAALERESFPEGSYGYRPCVDGVDLWPQQDTPERQASAVRFVSLLDAQAYCAWRSEEARRAGGSERYRLPSVEEWEKAARGVDGRPFPWGFEPGSTFARLRGAALLDVASHPELGSPYGLFHCASSVAEWTSTAAPGGYRVVGRSYDRSRDLIHLAWALPERPDFRGPATGFRVVVVERDE